MYRTCADLDKFLKKEGIEYEETFINYLGLKKEDFDFNQPVRLFEVPKDFTDNFVEMHFYSKRQELNEKRARNKQEKNNHANFDNFENYDSYGQDGMPISDRLEFSTVVF